MPEGGRETEDRGGYGDPPRNKGSPSRAGLRAAGEALLVAAGMVVFALLSAGGVARGWAAVAGLVLTGLALYLSMRTGVRPVRLFGLAAPRGWAWGLVAVGVALGSGLGAAYRWVWMPAVLPGSLHAFVGVAMLIGAAEEVLYRGYVQGRLAAAFGVRRPVLAGRAFPTARAAQAPQRTIDAAGERGGYADPPRSSAWARFVALGAAIFLAAAAHTAYKAALFAWPPAGLAIDYTFLVTWTLIGGVAFGALRAWAGSVWPALAAHVVFDVIAYGDAVRAPWWVWT